MVYYILIVICGDEYFKLTIIIKRNKNMESE